MGCRRTTSKVRQSDTTDGHDEVKLLSIYRDEYKVMREGRGIGRVK